MSQYLIIGAWLIMLLYEFMPRFGPTQYSSALGVVFFQSLTAVATYLCGKNCYLRIKGIEKTTGAARFFREVSSTIYALLAFLGCILIILCAYKSLTVGIPID
ncbi:MAG: hypothetical protein CVV41_10740 [Candidatus Riflebacteria bacterium HGW-Riflebacteria-1]|jgi:hypothetical protein|nr:MAG: hypothetical protein CVV41_10740 [Candidatus Riflebacteria bacterium HGW-Riflebacteria-1]